MIISRVRNRSIKIGDHLTSVAMEDEFWREYQRICDKLGVTQNELGTSIWHDSDRSANMSSTIRCYVLDWVKKEAEMARVARAAAIDQVASLVSALKGSEEEL